MDTTIEVEPRTVETSIDIPFTLYSTFKILNTGLDLTRIQETTFLTPSSLTVPDKTPKIDQS